MPARSMLWILAGDRELVGQSHVSPLVDCEAGDGGTDFPRATEI